MPQSPRLRHMLLLSLLLHLVVLCTMLLWYVFVPVVEMVSLPEDEAQLVALYEPEELPDLPRPEPEPPIEEPVIHEMLAFQSLSTIITQPTATPTWPPTPTPTPRKRVPTPTPTPRKLVPTPTSTPRKRVLTPTPKPTVSSLPTWTPRQETPPEKIVVDVPKRQPAIQRTPISGQAYGTTTPTPRPKPNLMPAPEHQGSERSPGLSNGPAVTLDQVDDFSFPKYLAYIEEKIAGIWFPQGSGTVSLYLIIERNGKILKSGVDKGEGVGVMKLRESVIRAIGMIKRFEPLPQGYRGVVLRVRITVRR